MDWKSKETYLKAMAPIMKKELYQNKRSMIKVATIYQVTVDEVYKAVTDYPPFQSVDFSPEKYSVILVDPDRVADAIELLRVYGIDCRVASNNHELTESYESNINH